MHRQCTGEVGRDVRTQCEKGDISQVKKPGKADDHIEANGQKAEHSNLLIQGHLPVGSDKFWGVDSNEERKRVEDCLRGGRLPCETSDVQARASASNENGEAEAEALGLARQLRLQGRAVELDLSAAAFGKQLKRADRSGAAWAVLIGDSEAEQGEVILKALRGPATAADQRASAAAAADQPASAVTAASVPEQEPVAERRLPQQELLRQFA